MGKKMSEIATFNDAKNIDNIISKYFFKDKHIINAAEAMRIAFEIPQLKFTVYGEPDGEIHAYIEGKGKEVLFQYLSRLPYEQTSRSREYYIDEFWQGLATGNPNYKILENFLADVIPGKPYDMMNASKSNRGLRIISETAMRNSWLYSNLKNSMNDGQIYHVSTMEFAGQQISHDWQEEKVDSKDCDFKTTDDILKFTAEFFHLKISSALAKENH